MMINRTQRELETLSTLIYGKEQIHPDLTLINVSSWKDSENNLHTFVYSEDDADVNSIKFNIGKIYEIFMDRKGLLYIFWEKLIVNFENEYDIDFFTLLSYIYMVNRKDDSNNRNAKVTSQIAFVLFHVATLKGGLLV